MFTNDKKTEKIDGKNYITFRPNTITYSMTRKQNWVKDINVLRLASSFTPSILGPSLPEMTSSFNVISDGDFNSGGNVWAEKAEFKDIGNVASLISLRQDNMTLVFVVLRVLFVRPDILNKIQSGKKVLQMDTEFLKFFNNYVKEGRNVPSVETAYRDFLYHMGKEYDKVITKNKTLKAQEKKVGKFIEMLAFVEDNQREMKMLIATYMNIQAKTDLGE